MLGEKAVLELEPLSLSPVVRGTLCPLAGKRTPKSKPFDDAWRLDVFNRIRLGSFQICPAAPLQTGHLWNPASPLPCTLLANLLALSRSREDTLLGWGRSLYSDTQCLPLAVAAPKFCRLPRSDLRDLFISSSYIEIQHLMRLNPAPKAYYVPNSTRETRIAIKAYFLPLCNLKRGVGVRWGKEWQAHKKLPCLVIHGVVHGPAAPPHLGAR